MFSGQTEEKMKKLDVVLKISGLAILLVLMGIGNASAKKYPELDHPEFENFREGSPAFNGELQVVAFNLEYGRHLDEELAYLSARLKKNPATVLLLSECDQYHSRSGDKFVAKEIARALKMDMAYVIEYVEYNDQTPATPGTTGNAILSPFPLTDVSVIRHREAFSWTDWGWLMGQPRKGGVVALGATVNVPGGPAVRVYCLHLESNTIHPLRGMQMLDVLPEADRFPGPLVLGGDFNSLPHTSAVRLGKRIGLKNAFAGDCKPTAWCFLPGDTLHCVVKIDWILYRGLELQSREVTPLMTAEKKRVSDHAAVSAVFRVK